MDWIKELGGPSELARIAGVKPPSVTEWRTRGIPPERCPAIERAKHGRVTCEQLRGDVLWVRIPDPEWPWHPAGRPAVDVGRAVKAAPTNEEARDAA